MKSKLKLLNELMGMDSNYQQYRQALREMMPSTASVPFLGLFLTDLTFLDEGNSELMSSAERSAPATPAASSSSPQTYADSSSATRTKRRSIFNKVKSDRSVKLESSKLREPSQGYKEDASVPAALEKAATMPDFTAEGRSPRPHSVHAGISSSQKTLKVLHKKAQQEDNSDKRLSLKAVRCVLSFVLSSLSLFMSF
jgi:hypothetical protein